MRSASTRQLPRCQAGNANLLESRRKAWTKAHVHEGTGMELQKGRWAGVRLARSKARDQSQGCCMRRAWDYNLQQ